MKIPFMAAAFATLLIASPGLAQQPPKPLIESYGTPFPTTGAVERPDSKLRYRVVFSVTKAAADPTKPSPSLDKIARFLNLLDADGVRIKPGDVVAIIYGPATSVVTTDAGYAAKTKATTNPNSPLIAKLQAAGVVVAVCGQALSAHQIATSDLAPGIRVDVAAMTTLVALQLRGFAVLTD